MKYEANMPHSPDPCGLCIAIAAESADRQCSLAKRPHMPPTAQQTSVWGFWAKRVEAELGHGYEEATRCCARPAGRWSHAPDGTAEGVTIAMPLRRSSGGRCGEDAMIRRRRRQDMGLPRPQLTRRFLRPRAPDTNFQA